MVDSKMHKDFPLISLFEMPFPVWRHACKTGRKNISKHLPQGQELPELAEEDYRLWYARYINHIAKNYHEFLEGIMSGFPEPVYPPEIQDMIISHKIRMTLDPDDTFPRVTRKVKRETLEDGEINVLDHPRHPVVIEYGHNTESGVDTRKRKMEDDFSDHRQKVARTATLPFDRRISHDSVPGTSVANGPQQPQGYGFKSEDEFKYKVKTLILYYLDKTLLEKGLIDSHTKKAKIPEAPIPNPFTAAYKPPGADIASKDKRGRDRLDKIRDEDTFQRSNSGSSERSFNDRSFNHVDNYRTSKEIPSRARDREPRDRQNKRDKYGRSDKQAEENSAPVIIPKLDSACEKCRKGEECWDC